ncbi:MAG: formate C-acetyltransferase/glycerol dehydratase family glycyl radical enzyme [Planctomycetota bacterium]|jgi:formate C-acetyltransferase|nr:formate C-acetyltransferase/glycerol dehydratase family glycyl radical enzyme [Planctomycetota bacterium]
MDFLAQIKNLGPSSRAIRLKKRLLKEPHSLSLEQALIITEVYQENPEMPVATKRALALAESLRRLAIRIEPEELIVGNPTAGVWAGVVFPEMGVSWIDRELGDLPRRAPDSFSVRPSDIATFRQTILPFWQGKTLEDSVRSEAEELLDRIARVVKINPSDYAQGGVCPDVATWLRFGPLGLRHQAEARLNLATPGKREFYQAVITVLQAAESYLLRYAELATSLAARNPAQGAELRERARICQKLAFSPAESFAEAGQSLWFLCVLLQLEGSAASFSPGRADQYLYPYLQADLAAGTLDYPQALEIIECLCLKFNQIAGLVNSPTSGSPINFTVTLGGVDSYGQDATNPLAFLFLKAQEHLGLPQPSLSVRLHHGTPAELLDACGQAIISRGSGSLPSFDDETVIPALLAKGVNLIDARNYAITGAAKPTPSGNRLYWPGASRFNLPKALELALNNGKCLVTGDQLGPRTGELQELRTYAALEQAFRQQIDFFFTGMLKAIDQLEEIHQRLLPTALLSAVLDDCLTQGLDVTRGGARYNYSTIPAIPTANIANSLAALLKLVYLERRVPASSILVALRNNFSGQEELRQKLLLQVPKYGNAVAWVEDIAKQWSSYFTGKFSDRTNPRGGPYHVFYGRGPALASMGSEVGATPDGRLSQDPLADPSPVDTRSLALASYTSLPYPEPASDSRFTPVSLPSQAALVGQELTLSPWVNKPLTKRRGKPIPSGRVKIAHKP